jgi:hypothetical protein
MSALGQKQTFAVHQPMSALAPKADIRSALTHVRFGPIADMKMQSGTHGTSPYILLAVPPSGAMSSTRDNATDHGFFWSVIGALVCPPVICAASVIANSA